MSAEKQGTAEVELAEATAAQVLPKPEPSQPILCRQCDHSITHPREAADKDGCHEHTFRNPAGYSFHVLCFFQAPGCKLLGSPTTDASWFAGFAWTLAMCEECGQHLGWKFSPTKHSDEAAFYGLIATRLQRPL